MVRLDGVLVVEDELAAFGYDDDLALEGELSDLVEADFEDVGCFDGGEMFGHGCSLMVQSVGMGWPQVWVVNVGRCGWPAG
jgi:hypothetical protein